MPSNPLTIMFTYERNQYFQVLVILFNELFYIFTHQKCYNVAVSDTTLQERSKL